jgi:Zn-dependent peptidase ImmA (M78 family)
MDQISIERYLKTDIEKNAFNEYKGRMPFKIVAFAKKLGIDVYDFDDISEVNEETGQNFTDNTISGVIISKNNKYKIFTNTFIKIQGKKNISHSSFTVAHELGHYFLHRSDLDRNTYFYNTFQNQKHQYTEEEKTREKEANNFAAELLMPEMLVISKWNENKEKPDAIGILAHYFNVSYLAMSFRVANVMNINSEDLLNLA